MEKLYVRFLRFLKIKKHDFLRFFWVVAHVFSNTDCTNYLMTQALTSSNRLRSLYDTASLYKSAWGEYTASIQITLYDRTVSCL